MKTAEQIKEELNYFTGTEHYYKHLFNIMFTDGVKYLADECQCYWLLDAIASWQSVERIMKEEFQVFRLNVKQDHSAILQIEDGNNNILATQEIEFTDFPLDEIVLWVENRVALLPSEH